MVIGDLKDLVRLLEEHPEWKAELRRVLLTEELLELPRIVSELAEAQKELAEAQRRTEQKVEELAEAQKELAEAQKRTERALQALAKQVGGLSETVGGDIEDIAYIVVHDVLEREKGWQVGVLERSWQDWNGVKIEINLLGTAKKPQNPQQPIWIVGEAKHNLTLNDVKRFVRVVELAKRNLKGEVFPVCFCYRARPEVREKVKELEFHLVFSYGRLI